MPPGTTIEEVTDATSLAASTPRHDGDVADFVISVMFLTASVMVGSFLSLINSRNQELRAFTWAMLESVMAIFVAVMISEAGKDILLLLTKPKGIGVDVANVAYAILCSIAAQVATHALVSITGSMGRGLNRKMVYTRALMGVIARFQAFAWLGFWARLQIWVSKLCSYGPLIPVLAAVQMCLLTSIFEWVRLRYVKLDGEVNDGEAEWMQLTLKNEIEATGMCISYCFCQWVRFWVGGRMPDPGGVEYAATDAVNHAAFEHEWSDIGLLFLVAVLFRVLGDFVNVKSGQWVAGVRGDACKRALERVLMIFVNTCLKECGWLLLFTVTWIIGKIRLVEAKHMGEEKKLSTDCVQARAITAIACSYFSFLVIVILGKVQVSWTGFIKTGTLQSLIVTVGFSWRRWFGLCIDTVTIYLGPKISKYFCSSDKDCSRNGEFILEIAISIFMAVALIPSLLHQVTPSAILMSEATLDEERRSSRRSLAGGGLELAVRPVATV